MEIRGFVVYSTDVSVFFYAPPPLVVLAELIYMDIKSLWQMVGAKVNSMLLTGVLEATSLLAHYMVEEFRVWQMMC
jgi:hypothetical protein